MAKYKATAYIRLSYTDDRSSESDSVSNQRKLIENFVERSPDIEVVSYKVDDGYSGIIFDRPAFKEMMQDVTNGEINCVIVKDLSRLGREYIETGRYLRKVFPAYGVRFIAITDNIDTAQENKEYHYYYCPTGKKHGCANPVMLKESKLIDCVQESLKAYIQNVASLETLLNSIDQSSINQALAKEYTDHISENERRLEHAQNCKSRLYENLVEGMITKEEYASYKVKYTRQAEEIKAAITALKEKLKDVLENKSERNRWISHFTQFEFMETLDRKALIHMVQSIQVRGKNELDIRFNYMDEYEKALRLAALAVQEAKLPLPEGIRKVG